MRCCKDLMLHWACDMLRKEMSGPDKNVVQSLHFFLFFCKLLKIGKVIMNWKRIYNEFCHIFSSVVFPVIFLSSQ